MSRSRSRAFPRRPHHRDHVSTHRTPGCPCSVDDRGVRLELALCRPGAHRPDRSRSRHAGLASRHPVVARLPVRRSSGHRAWFCWTAAPGPTTRRTSKSDRTSLAVSFHRAAGVAPPASGTPRLPARVADTTRSRSVRAQSMRAPTRNRVLGSRPARRHWRMSPGDTPNSLPASVRVSHAR